MGKRNRTRSERREQRGERGAAGVNDAARPRSAIVSSLPLWQQYQRIGGNLTPAQVSSILYQADSGDPSRLVELANECRQRDGHLHGVLETREQSLGALTLTVVAAQERGRRTPKRQDARIAAFVQDALDGAGGDGQALRGLSGLVQDLQGALYHGYSVAEIRWARRGDKLVPTGFRHINQRRFGFRDQDGRLVWRDSFDARHGVELRATYPGQFVQHQPRVNGDVAAREGLARILIWAALFRNWGIADWLKLAELSWKPWRIGRLTRGAGKEDRDGLLNVLERLTTNGVGLLTEAQDIQFNWPGSQGGGGTSGRGNHQALCEFMAAEMSKAVLGGTLSTQEGSRGARNLGEVHERKELARRERDAQAVAETLRRDLVQPLVRMNFGASAAIPRLALETEETADLKSFGEALGQLNSAGMRVPRKWAHDQAGVPEPFGDEPVLGEREPDDHDSAAHAANQESDDETAN